MRCLSIPGYLFGNLRGFRGEVNCCLITLNPLTFPGSKQLYVKGLIFFTHKEIFGPDFDFSFLANSTRKSKKDEWSKVQKSSRDFDLFFSKRTFFHRNFDFEVKKNHSTWWKHVIMINEPFRAHIMQGKNVS